MHSRVSKVCCHVWSFPDVMHVLFVVLYLYFLNFELYYYYFTLIENLFKFSTMVAFWGNIPKICTKSYVGRMIWNFRSFSFKQKETGSFWSLYLLLSLLCCVEQTLHCCFVNTTDYEHHNTKCLLISQSRTVL